MQHPTLTGLRPDRRPTMRCDAIQRDAMRRGPTTTATTPRPTARTATTDDDHDDHDDEAMRPHTPLAPLRRRALPEGRASLLPPTPKHVFGGLWGFWIFRTGGVFCLGWAYIHKGLAQITLYRHWLKDPAPRLSDFQILDFRVGFGSPDFDPRFSGLPPPAENPRSENLRSGFPLAGETCTFPGKFACIAHESVHLRCMHATHFSRLRFSVASTLWRVRRSLRVSLASLTGFSPWAWRSPAGRARSPLRWRPLLPRPPPGRAARPQRR